MKHKCRPQGGGFFRSLFGWVLLGSLAIAGGFLIAEHRAHIFGSGWVAPAFLAVFVGLHLLMHLGHGSHDGHSPSGDHQPPTKKEFDDGR